DRGAGSAVSRTAQLIVHDTGRSRERVADFTHTDPNRRPLYHAIRQRALLIEIEAVDPYVSRRLRTEAPHLTRAVHADRLQPQRQTKRIFGRGDRIVGRMLRMHGTHVGDQGNSSKDDGGSHAHPSIEISSVSLGAVPEPAK